MKSATPVATLAPGAVNQFDSDTYKTLATAHAFALSAAGNAKMLTPAEKAALNQFIQYLNAADALYVLYHSGAATQAAMQAALTAVGTSEAAYSATITGGR